MNIQTAFYVFLAIFFFFLAGVAVYGEFLIRRGRAETGFGISSFSFKVISTLFIIALIFFLTGIIFIKEEPEREIIGLPRSPAEGYPPPPDFIEMAGYYFSGPWKMGEEKISEDMIFVVFCREDGRYKALSAEPRTMETSLERHFQYSCWMENCKKENLYIAVLPVEEEEKEEGMESFIKTGEKAGVLKEIKAKINFICD